MQVLTAAQLRSLEGGCEDSRSLCIPDFPAPSPFPDPFPFPFPEPFPFPLPSPFPGPTFPTF